MKTLKLKTRKTLAAGDTGSFTKTVTENDIFQFASASGDYNPLHVDEEYARRSVFGERVAHGILTTGIVSAVLGGEIPGVGTIFLELHVRFLKPVHIGDTVRATATVQDVQDPKRVAILIACVNQDGVDVAIGHAIVLPPKETVILSERTPGNGT